MRFSLKSTVLFLSLTCCVAGIASNMLTYRTLIAQILAFNPGVTIEASAYWIGMQGAICGAILAAAVVCGMSIVRESIR